MQLNVSTQTVEETENSNWRKVSEHQVSVTSCELIDLLNDDYWNKEAPFKLTSMTQKVTPFLIFIPQWPNFFFKMVLHEVPALLCHELLWLNPVHFVLIKSKSPAALN